MIRKYVDSCKRSYVKKFFFVNIRNVINISKFTIFHFQQELDIKSHIEKKLKFTEEEKHRVECRLKNTELELKESETSLEHSNSKRKVS